MKRWTSFLLAFLLAVVLTACGGTQQQQPEPEKPTQTVEKAEIEQPALPAQTPAEAPTETPADLPAETPDEVPETPEDALLPEGGTYTSKEDVALYIYQYGRLPQNFITKKDAEKLGWPGGSLEPYAPGMCIGGSKFGNYEERLPKAKGRTYTECDIDTLGASKRGAKRIVFSDDGLIYYTEDHYETFELLYGEEP